MFTPRRLATGKFALSQDSSGSWRWSFRNGFRNDAVHKPYLHRRINRCAPLVAERPDENSHGRSRWTGPPLPTARRVATLESAETRRFPFMVAGGDPSPATKSARSWTARSPLPLWSGRAIRSSDTSARRPSIRWPKAAEDCRSPRRCRDHQCLPPTHPLHNISTSQQPVNRPCTQEKKWPHPFSRRCTSSPLPKTRGSPRGTSPARKRRRAGPAPDRPRCLRRA